MHMALIRLWLDARSEVPSFHMRALVRVVGAYSAYRIISRPAFQYGLLESEHRNWPRPSTNFYPEEFYGVFGFPYFLGLYWPSPEFIASLQLVGLMGALFLVFGLWPRYSALALFLTMSYTTWMMQISNAELDGGTLVLALSLWFVFFNSSALGFGRPTLRSASVVAAGGSGASLERGKLDSARNSLLGAQIIVGTFYALSGINKLVDVGFDWPLRLRLPNQMLSQEYLVVHESARLGVSPLLHFFGSSEALSVIAGFTVLFAELLTLPALLLLRRARFLCVLVLAMLHIVVFLTVGINFLGNLFVLFAALDLSRGARRFIGYGTKLRRLLPVGSGPPSMS